MDILTEFEEYIEHIFIYDNATTHKEHADNEISTRNMPKNTPAAGKNWLVDAILCDEQDMPVKNAEGSHSKVKVRMKDAVFNGTSQPLYFPEGHPHSGVFKGMAVILEEWDIHMQGTFASSARASNALHPLLIVVATIFYSISRLLKCKIMLGD